MSKHEALRLADALDSIQRVIVAISARNPGKNWLKHAAALLRTIPSLEAHIAELQAERDALRADADRYRWLRDTSTMDHPVSMHIATGDDESLAIDAAIDAAMLVASSHDG